MSRVLCFGDPHSPFTKKGFYKFLKKMAKKWRCKKFVCAGDLVDSHRLARFTPEPDAKGDLDEYKETLKNLQELYKLFPTVTCVMGNHDLRVYRKAKEAGIGYHYLKEFREIVKAPRGWKFVDADVDPLIIDNVRYQHEGVGTGANAHILAAQKNRRSTVCAHAHAHAGIKWSATDDSLIFGANCGSGADDKAYAMRYGQSFPEKPVLGCLVVINGKDVYFENMWLGSKVIYKKKKRT